MRLRTRMARLLILALILQLLPLQGLFRFDGTAFALPPVPPLSRPVPPRDQWVEDPTLRSAHGRVFRAGAYMAAEISAHPVHVQDESGKWHPIDTSVRSSNAGEFESNPGPFQVRFSNKEQGNTVRLELGRDRVVEMGADDAGPGNAQAALLGPARFSPRAEGNKLSYRDQRGLVDIEYEVTGQGVKESIVLRKGADQSEFVLPVNLQGLDIRAEADGSYTLFDQGTSIVSARIPAAFAVDAAGEVTFRVQQELVPFGTGMAFRIAVDREWLEAKERRFPVVIDPSIVLGGALATTATISNQSPDSPTPGVFSVHKRTATSDSVGLVKYNLSSIPDGAIIHDARLDIYRTPNTTSTHKIGTYEASAEWYPALATWKTPRGQNTVWPGGSFTTGASYGDILAQPVPVTPLVQKWVNRTHPNWGFVFRDLTMMPLGYTTVPVLQVVYTTDGTAPTVSLQGLTGGQVISSPVTLTLNAQDPAPGGVGRVELLVDGAVAETWQAPTGPISHQLDPRTYGPGPHTVTTRAFDFAGNAAVTAPVEIRVEIPLPPQDLMVTPKPGGADLTWQPAIQSQPITYKVYRSTSATGITDTVPIATGLTEPRYSDASLTRPMAETYYYAVSAVDGQKESRAVTAPAVHRMAPEEATSVSQTNGTVKVTWPASPRPGVTYNVYRSTTPGFQPEAGNRVASGVSGLEYTEGHNVMANGSFQFVSNGMPLWWTAQNGSSSQMSVDTVERQVGENSLRITRSTGQPAANLYAQAVRGIPGGVRVTVSAWSKAAGVTTAQGACSYLKVDLNPSAYYYYKSANLTFSAGSHDWERKSVTFDTSVDANWTANLTIVSTCDNSTVWFDGIQVEAGDTPTAYQEGLPAQGTPVYRVTAVDGPYESAPSPDTTVVIGPPPPGLLSLRSYGDRGLVSWEPSPEPGVTYNFYQSNTAATPPGSATLMASGLTATAYEVGRNRASNAGFEEATSQGQPTAWSLCSPCTAPKVEAGGMGGTKALVINRATAAEPEQTVRQTAYVYQKSLTPVTVSVYSKAQNVAVVESGNYSVSARFFDGSWSVIETRSADFQAGTHDWERVAFTVTPGRPIYAVEVTLTLRGSSTGTVWFDNVQVESGTSPTTWQPGMTNGTAYYYVVRAVNAAGVESRNSAWQQLSLRDLGLPTPTDFTAVSRGGGVVDLAWTPSAGVTYTLYRGTVTSTGQLGPYSPFVTEMSGSSYRISGKNLLLNPGLTDDANKDYYPDSWTRVNNVNISGTRLSIYRESTYPEAQAYQDVPLNQALAAPLTLSGTVSPPCTTGMSLADVGLRMELFDHAGRLAGSGVASPTTCAGGRVSVTVTPNTPATSARITLFMRGSATGYAYFSQTQLEAGTQATAWEGLSAADGAVYAYLLAPNARTPDLQTGAVTPHVPVTHTWNPLPTAPITAKQATSGGTQLTWSASPTPDVTYSVYRLDTSRPASERIRIAEGVTGTTYTDPGNLLAGSGFDADANGDSLPDGWTWAATSPGGTLDGSAAKYGKASFKVSRSSTAAGPLGVTQTIMLNQAQATPVVLSGWHRTASLSGGSASDCAISITLQGFSGETVGTTTLPCTAGTHDWEFKSAAITPSAPVRQAVVQAQMTGGATGTVWFDALQLQPGTSATTWTEGPVTPGTSFSYWLAPTTGIGREAISAVPQTFLFQPWALAGPGEVELGLDDRWSYVDFPVPGGTAYLNLTNGNVALLATDSVVPGPHLAQVVRRTYNSLQTPATGPLGNGAWSLNAIQTLTTDASGNVDLTEGDGTRIRFTPNQAGGYTAPPSVWMTLQRLSSGPYTWEIRRRDGIRYLFDSTGRLRELSEPNGNTISYTYGASGRLEAVAGPATLTATLTYDSQGRLTQVTDAAGRTVQYGYDASGRLITTTDPLGIPVTYTYNSAGRIETIADGGGRRVRLGYDTSGRLQSYTWDGTSEVTTFAYETLNGAVYATVTNPAGHATRFGTNQAGSLLETRDPLGNMTRFAYDDLQRLTSVANPRDLVTEVRYEGQTPRVLEVIRRGEEEVITRFAEYSALDKPGLITDPTGMKTRLVYDSAGNLLEQTVADGTPDAATTRYTYTTASSGLPPGMPVTVTDPEGAVTTYAVDERGQVRVITNPVGGETRLEYDEAGNLIKAADPTGQVTTHSYDAMGRRLRTTAPDGGLSAWIYNRSGLLQEAVAPGGYRNTYAYDPAGRLISQTDNLEQTTRYGYDKAGNPVLTIYPNGTMARQEYDATGRVVRAYDGNHLNAEGLPFTNALYVEYGYDAAGNLVRRKLPGGYSSTAEYDLLNRLIKVTDPPATTTFTYDQAGRRLTQRDANGNWTRWQYDTLGRLVRVYDAANLTESGQEKAGAVFTAYTYDKTGRRTAVTDPMNGQTRYFYNGLGQVVKSIDQLGQPDLYEYDKAGRLVASLNRNGNTTTYQYDPVGRATEIRYQGGCDLVRYTYNAAGQRTTMADSHGLTTYHYDPVGRLIAEESPNGTLRYEYDALGLRKALVLAEGSIGYEYDKANRVTKITDIAGSVSTFKYGPDGEILETKVPGSTQTQTFDPVTRRLKELKLVYGGQTTTYAYQYDPVGNITQLTKNGIATQYTYDALYRLVEELQWTNSTSAPYTSYVYDATGNRTRQDTGTAYRATATGSVTSRTLSGYTTYQYNAAGWLLQSGKHEAKTDAPPPEVIRYSYEGDGSLREVHRATGIERYTYNSRGDLTKVQLNNQLVFNDYNGDSRRVARRVVDAANWELGSETTTQVTRYLYDGVFVLAERDGTNSLLTAYARQENGRLLSWYKPQETTNRNGGFATDHLGSVVAVLGPTGTTLNSYDYDSFGQVKQATEAVPNSLKFTGAPLDGSGLYHLGARYYNPAVGRFITQDTWKGDPWTPWTQNLYTYVGNNPVNYVDPTGHYAESPWDLFSLQLSLHEFATNPNIGTGLLVLIDGAAVVLPGVPGGAGAIAKATKAGYQVLRFIDKVHDSVKLADNMGGAKLANWAAHHIVPGNLKRAEGLRQQIFKAGIGINDAINGVFLRPKGIHSRLNDHRYVEWVERMLYDAGDDPAKISERLEQIATTLDEWDKIIEGSTGAERNHLFREFWDAIAD